MHCARPLILGEDAPVVRRQIGPTAWSALEVLASRSVDEAGSTVAVSSVRDVAAALGVAKNTAHRAIRALIAAGIATPDQGRERDGRFLLGLYRLAIPADVLRLVPPDVMAATAPTSRQVTHSTRSRDLIGTQLDLLANLD